MPGHPLSPIASKNIRGLMDRGYFAHHNLKAGVMSSPLPTAERSTGRTRWCTGARRRKPEEEVRLLSMTYPWP